MNAESYKQQGNAALGRGDFQEAVESYTKAIEMDGTNHILYSNRSAAYASLEQWENALADAEKTVEIKPDWGKGYSRKGLALRNLNRVIEALEAYEAGLKVEPENEQLAKAAQDLRLSSGQQQIAMLFGQAFQGDVWGKLRASPKMASYINDPSFVALIDSCRQNPSRILEKFSDKRLQEALGVLLKPPGGMGPQDHMETEEDVHPPRGGSSASPSAASSEKPAAEKPSEQKASASSGSAKPSTPAASTGGVVNEEAEKAKNEGNEAFKQRDFSAAIRHYQRAVELDDKSVIYRTNLAAALIEVGQFDEAIAVCEKAIEIGRAHMAAYEHMARAYTRLGNAHMKKGDLAAAVDAYRSAQTECRDRKTAELLRSAEIALEKKREVEYLSPEKALEAKALGNECFQKGDFPGAVAHYSESLKRNPQDAAVYANRAAAYTKLGELPYCIKDCDAALKIDHTYVKAYLRKANAQYVMKQYYKAMETYQAALEHCPGGRDPEVERGVQQCLAAMQTQPDDATVNAALKDPEIQDILRDPMIQKALEDMKTNPRAASVYLADPKMRDRIFKLRNAGILQMQ